MPRNGFEFEFGRVGGHCVPGRENSVRRRIRGTKEFVIRLPFCAHAKRNGHDLLRSGLGLNFPALLDLAIAICLQTQFARLFRTRLYWLRIAQYQSGPRRKLDAKFVIRTWTEAGPFGTGIKDTFPIASR